MDPMNPARLGRREFLYGTAGLTAAALAASGCSTADPKTPAATPAIPQRETYTFPPEAEPLAKGLVEAGIPIVFGPNSVAPPAGISEPAKEAWTKLAQLPLPADDPAKLAAVRQFSAAAEQDHYATLSATHTLEDRTVDGVTTLRITPRTGRHPDKAMIFIHGGAWIVNSRKTQLPLQCAVADALGMPVISIEYRLAPEHPYPAALDDVIAAYTGIIKDLRPENVGIFGTSAGGGLTLATLLRLQAEGVPLPAAAAPLCPGADMTHSGYLFSAVGLNDPVLAPYDIDLAMRGYVGNATATDPLVSPVFGDYTGCPPLFLLATTAEIIGSDAVRVAQNARAAGVDTTLYISDGMWHVPIGDATGVPEVQRAYGQLIAFLRKHLRVS